MNVATRMPTYLIRKIFETDIPAIKKIIDECDLFPSELVNDMVSGYLTSSNGDKWIGCDGGDGVLTGLAYYIPEKLTSGTW